MSQSLTLAATAREHLPHAPAVTFEGHFLSGVKVAWIQNFTYPIPVAKPRLKNLVYPTN